MANVLFKDGGGTDRYRKASGAGTDLNPFVYSLPIENASGTVISPATEATLAALGTTLSGTLTVDGSGVTQPISVASLPLPAGAATEAALTALLTELEGKAGLGEVQPVSASTLPLPTGAATEATLTSINTALDGVLTVDGSGTTQPISVAALPLPAGAATETGLSALLTELQSKADLSETQPVSAASLPLPTGAATAANQASTLASLGDTADTTAASDGGTFSLIALVKRLLGKFPAALGTATASASFPVVLPSDQAAIPADITIARGSASDLSGTTSGTADVWTELDAADAGRTAWAISGGTADLIVGTGTVGNEVPLFVVPAGSPPIGDTAGVLPVELGRLVIKCSSTVSIPFVAHKYSTT